MDILKRSKFVTEQTVFNRVVKHLRKQGRKSKAWYYDFDGDKKTLACAYRGKDGLKCAIGCLIPNKTYQKDMEGAGPITALTKAGVYGKYKKLGDCLLFELQLIHDDWHPVAWEKAFRELAIRYELKYAPPVKK